jgi:hypothetical protein
MFLDLWDGSGENLKEVAYHIDFLIISNMNISA